MGLPDAVKRQAEQANKMVEDLGTPTPAPTPPVETSPAPATPAPVITPAPTPPAPEPPTPGPAPVPPEPPVTPAPPAPEDVQHKLDALLGRFNVVVEESKVLKAQNQALLNQLTRVVSTPPAEPVAPVKVELPEAIKTLEQDYPDIYQGMIAFVDMALAKNNEKTAEQVFYDDLSKVPNWQQINQDPGFLTFLQQHDRYSGETLQVMLNEAYQGKDGKRAVTFFKDYLDSLGGPPPPSPPNPMLGTPPITPNPQPNPKEEFLAPPSTPRVSIPPVTPVELPITRKEIAQFYDDCKQLKYRGREAEKTAYEARIIQAVRDHKVT